MSYIIGRNTIQPETADEIKSGKNVLIYAGLNDELKFDFTYQGIPTKSGSISRKGRTIPTR